jgi:flagellar biosynthetic protein FlhB
MADAPDRDDATEEPTRRRLEKARQEGQVAVSREATSLLVLIAGMFTAFVTLPGSGQELISAFGSLIARSHAADPIQELGRAARAGLGMLLPVAIAVIVAAVAATLLQTRGVISANGIMPRLSKLSPIAGAKRLFGKEGLMELLRTFVKLAVVGIALWFAFGTPEIFQQVLHRPAGSLLGVAERNAAFLIGAAAISFALLAVADVWWIHSQHRRQLRMTRQELKDEMKETEGRPEIKAELRRLREELSKGRMMAAVPKAAVVITNPTHYAVALAYSEGSDAAPKVVAKGQDEVASRIREAARGAGVPLVSNPPLARALHKLDLDAEIPPEHFQAVAEIIAFVWRTRRKVAGP